MSNHIDIADTVAALTILFVVSTINSLLIYRRRTQGIKALDNLILIFSALNAMVIFQTLHIFLPDLHPMFDVDSSVSPVMVDPVRIFNFLFILALYRFVEQTLNPTPNRIRAGIVLSGTVSIIVIGSIDVSRGILILTSDIIPFGADERVDEMIFDFVQLVVITFTTYVFYQQQRYIVSPELKRFSRYLVASGLLFTAAIIVEFLEHFIDALSIDAFITALPTVILLGYVYILNPRFVYLVPTEIRFLQVVNSGGTTVYAAEFTKEVSNLEFLVGPGLFSISMMIGELIGSGQRVEISSIDHSQGVISFEHHGGLTGVVQTSRDSTVLRASLAYFLEEFAQTFAEDLESLSGRLGKGNEADDLLVKCIPIVEARPIVSGISRDNVS